MDYKYIMWLICSFKGLSLIVLFKNTFDSSHPIHQKRKKIRNHDIRHFILFTLNPVRLLPGRGDLTISLHQLVTSAKPIWDARSSILCYIPPPPKKCLTRSFHFSRLLATFYNRSMCASASLAYILNIPSRKLIRLFRLKARFFSKRCREKYGITQFFIKVKKDSTLDCTK